MIVSRDIVHFNEIYWIKTLIKLMVLVLGKTTLKPELFRLMNLRSPV